MSKIEEQVMHESNGVRVTLIHSWGAGDARLLIATGVGRTVLLPMGDAMLVAEAIEKAWLKLNPDVKDLTADKPQDAEWPCGYDVGDGEVCRCLLLRGHAGMHECKHVIYRGRSWQA